MKSLLCVFFSTLVFWSCTSRTTDVTENATLKYELIGNLTDGYAVEYTDPLGNTVSTSSNPVPGGWTKTFTIPKDGKCYSIKGGGAYQGGNTVVNIYINDQLVATKQCNCMINTAQQATACY